MFAGFEIEQTELTAHDRMKRGNVVLSHELVDLGEIEQTASYLIENHQAVSEIPIEDEHLSNAITGLFEKITASGHLSHIEFDGDQEQIHIATLQRLLNGYMLEKPAWEKARNFREICEELFVYRAFMKIVSGELPEDTVILTASDVADEAVSTQEKVDNGYRMLNHKGMLRSFHFEQTKDGEWVRILEQVSRSNSHDGSTRRWFNENSASVPISSTGGLSIQVLGTRERLPDGIVTWTSELDGIFEVDRFCGEIAQNVEESHEGLREASAQREQALSKHSQMLAEFDHRLKLQQSAGVITYEERLTRFYQYIEDTLVPRILLNAPEYARDTYGEQGGVYMEQAAYHFQRGETEQARAFTSLGIATKLKEASVGCGGSGVADGNGAPDDVLTIVNNAVDGAIEDKNDWTWTDGVCRVESCSTRPGKTKVGPCSVCKTCQAEFDAGRDPTQGVHDRTKESSGGILSLVLPRQKGNKDEEFALAA